ncbi:MAG: hypothetical protein KDA53_12715 [Hyphomonas sp.]|nr:hypothetical protein [Hyphomonas sp.]
MSKGKTKSTQTTSTRSTLAPWSMSQWDDLSGRIRGGIDDFRAGIGAYDGPLVAGLSDSEIRAGGMIDQATGAWRDQLGGLSAMLGENNFARMEQIDPSGFQTLDRVTPQTFADFDAGTYVNPYADDMIGAVTGDLTRAADRARMASTADTLTSGAYGGSRHGVRDALIDETLLRQIGDTSAGVRFDTWNAGADNFYRDVGNRMTADQINQDATRYENDLLLNITGMNREADAYNNDLTFQRTQGLAELLGLERQYEGEDIDRMLGYGALERGVTDRQNAAGYADFMRQRDELMKAMGLDFGLLGAVPMLVDQDGTSTQVQSSNPGLLGIAGSLLSGGSLLFGADGMFGKNGFFGPPQMGG